jgi:hypothetical protein
VVTAHVLSDCQTTGLVCGGDPGELTSSSDAPLLKAANGMHFTRRTDDEQNAMTTRKIVDRMGFEQYSFLCLTAPYSR